MMRSRSEILRWGVRCTGFVILGYLLHRIGPEKLWRTVSSVKPLYFAAALPIFFVMIWVKSVKMRALMKSPMKLSDIYFLNAFAFSLGSITPGRLGEFSKIIFLSRRGIALSESFSVTLIDRLADVAGMVSLAVCGLYVFFGTTAGWAGAAAAAAIFLFALSLWFSDQMLRRITRGKLKEWVELEGDAIRSYIRSLSLKAWTATFVLTMGYLGFYFLQMWILAKGLDLPIGYIQTAMAISASAVPAILPISVFNVGPRDAVLAAIFSRMGWGAENGVALSTLILGLFLLNGLFGLFFLPRRAAPC